MINKQPFSSFVAGLSSLVVGTACSEYDCHDTATCPLEPDAGPNIPTETSSITSASTSADSTEATPSSTSRPELSTTEGSEPVGSAATSASTSGDIETSSQPGDQTSSEPGGQTSEQPGAELGASCETALECESEFCADGVCCDTECTEPCQACSSDGSCSETPENDSECETITCPTSNLCATYPSPNTEPECLTLGQCATEADYCLPTFAAVGTTCGTGLECDGAGNCESVCGAGEVWCEDACVGEGSCRTWREPQSLVEVSRRISLARTAVTESGNVAVAWIEYESDNAVSKDLMARFYDADTGTWSAPTTVHTTSTYMANVTVAPSGPDGFVFLWDESIDAAVTSRYWTGSSWDGLVTLTPRSSSVQRAYPSNGRSSVLAVWSEYDETPTYTIRASTWEPRTGTWNAPQTLHTSEEYFGEITSTITPESAAFVVWQQAPAVTPNDWELWGARLASGGNNWSAADRFGSALDRQSGFDLGVTQQGDLIGYLAGRLKGVIWDASVTSWIEVNSSGDYTALDLCSLQTNNVLVAEPTRLQRWNRSSGRIAPALDLGAGWARGTLGGRGMRRKDGAHHVVQGRNDALRSVG